MGRSILGATPRVHKCAGESADAQRAQFNILGTLLGVAQHWTKVPWPDSRAKTTLLYNAATVQQRGFNCMFLYFVAVDVILIFWLNWWAGSNRQLDG